MIANSKKGPGPKLRKGERNLTQTTGKNAPSILRILIVIILLIIVVMSINTLMIKILYKKEYSEHVTKYSQEYGVDENLIYALIKAESNFEADAVSNRNAQGLMQLMPATAEEVANKNEIELTEDNILDPEININIGTKYISTLLEKYESVEIALAAYNAGIGNVDKWIENRIIKADGSDIENIPFKETNNYVRKIMRDYKIYSEK